MKKNIKLLACFLAFVIIISSIGVNSFATTDVEKTEEVTIVEEDLSKRGETEKHFINTDGSYTAMSYNEAVHFEKDGEWSEIDNTLERRTDENGNTVIENKNGPVEVTFNENPSDGEIGKISYDGYSLSWDTVAKTAVDDIAEFNPDIKERLPQKNEIVEPVASQATTSEPVTSEPTTSELITSIEPRLESEYDYVRTTSSDARDVSTESFATPINDYKTTSLPSVFDDMSKSVTEKFEEKIINIGDETHEISGDVNAVIADLQTPDLTEEELKTAVTVKSTLVFEDAIVESDSKIDFEYEVQTAEVKENIIISKRSEVTSYVTTVNTPHLTPTLYDDGMISFTNDAGEEIYRIPAPYMFDNNDEISYDIITKLNILEDGTCEIVYIPNYEWLNDVTRMYPVVIDPTFQVLAARNGTGNTEDAYINAAFPGKAYTDEYLKVGKYPALMSTQKSFIRFVQLPSLPSKHVIVSAGISINCTVNYGPTISMYRITGKNWDAAKMTWNLHANNDMGYRLVSDYNISSANKKYAPDKPYYVADMVAAWYRGEPNYGVMLETKVDNTYEWVFYSSRNSSALVPGLSVCYYDLYSANIQTDVYNIVSRADIGGRFLDIQAGKTANGTPVWLFANNATSAQHWYIENLGNDNYKIVSNKDRNYGLNVIGGHNNLSGTAVGLWNCHNTFKIYRHSRTGTLVIMPLTSNRQVFEIESNINSGTHRRLRLFECADTTTAYNQQWYLKPAYTYVDSKSDKQNCFGYVFQKNENIGPNYIASAKNSSAYAEEIIRYITKTFGRECKRIDSYNAPIDDHMFRMAFRRGKDKADPNEKPGFHVIYQLSNGDWVGKNGTGGYSQNFGKGDPSHSPKMWNNNQYPESMGTIYFAVTKANFY